MQYLRQKRKGKTSFMSLKLDISKAYNRVEWSFIKPIMNKLGFEEAWIKKVIMCVKFVSFSILINREPKCFIEPSRGLQQGDLLSPYLFLIYIERLISLLSKATKAKQITGI